ncbi:MAG: hypothetical protein ACMXYD_02350 [Candidatus Woesearchaeota archaeon]
MRLDKQETQDTLITIFLLTIALSILLIQVTTTIQQAIFTSLLAITISVLARQAAQKYFAHKHNKQVTFQINTLTALLSIPVAFIGVLLAAPGKTIISGFVSRKEQGIIAAIGPITSLAIALITLTIFFTGINTALIASFVLLNSYYALFTLLPLWEFDGEKIFTYNKTIYAALITTSAVLAFIASTYVLPTL